MHWLRSLIFYLALTMIALFIGGIGGLDWGLGFALGALSIILLFHLTNLYRLDAWLEQRNADQIPGSILLWQDIFDRLYDDARSQKKTKARLSATLERFMSAGMALPDGVIILDEHDRIEWCNPAAGLHLGLEARADAGQQVTNLIRHPTLRDYLQEQDFSHPLILRVVRPQELVLSIQLVPFDSTRKLLLSRDITSLDRVQTVHRDFIANVSHELRTPLTVVGGFIETLIDMPEIDAATRTRQLQMMNEQTSRMQRLVDDLLTLSRLENSRQLREEECDVPQLLPRLLTEAQGLSQGRHQIALAANAAPRILGNFDELHSALGNLVSNAIRYTPEGGQITLGWELRDGQAVFFVRDTGIGLAPEHIPRLTERFYRVDSGRSRNTGGTGLGLAIVKHILQRHQALLHIQSELGAGSEFAVHFPPERLLA